MPSEEARQKKLIRDRERIRKWRLEHPEEEKKRQQARIEKMGGREGWNAYHRTLRLKSLENRKTYVNIFHENMCYELVHYFYGLTPDVTDATHDLWRCTGKGSGCRIS